MDTILELLKEINIGQLVAIGAMFWFFYSRLEAKIEKLDEKLETRTKGLDDKITCSEKSLGLRIDKLSERVEDVDRRLCRIEGSLATQGHCLFHKQQEEKHPE